MNTFEITCGILGALSASASVFFWIKSATASVKPDTSVGSDGFQGGGYFDSNGNDVANTMQEQSYWNKWAAIAAAIATSFQALLSILPLLK